MTTRGLGLLTRAGLTRRQLIGFALTSAVLNGIITASVGAWLGQTYAKYQARRQSIESMVHLVYERRTRAGMVASALRRGADIDEIRFRKRAYDEAYVEWNKNIMQDMFAVREITGEHTKSNLEKYLEDGLVAAMSDVDRCLTKAYDVRIANGDPKPVLEQCRLAEQHQFILDCGATFTNELYKLSKLSFLPFARNSAEGKDISEGRIAKACVRPEEPKPAAKPEAKPETKPVDSPPSPPTAAADPQAPPAPTPAVAPQP